jgi:hypothetical protein
MISRTRQEGLFLAWEPPIEELRQKLLTFGTQISAKYLGAALNTASEPALRALKAEVKKRNKVTGNLARAVVSKVKRYPRTGNAIALIGFRAVSGRRVPEGGDDAAAFHAGLLEFGTKERTTRGVYASSFRSKSSRRSNFTVVQAKRKGKNARRMFKAAKTKPAYPRAFFTRAAAGETVRLGRVRPYAPIKRAWEQTRSQCQQVLAGALYDAVINASRDLFAPR